MEYFGSRLKEERERLDLSQAKFAEACGVGKTAQFNYEAGERFPDTMYLGHAATIGVNVEYIITGRKTVEWRTGLRRVLAQLERRLGVSAITLEGIVSLIAEDEQNRRNVTWGSRHVQDGQLALLIDAVIDESGLIDTILHAIGGATLKLETNLPPDKFVRVALMLLQQFRESGCFDETKVNDAVALAIP
jgi:transcriptional regulator with XRE-family HTH domain